MRSIVVLALVLGCDAAAAPPTVDAPVHAPAPELRTAAPSTAAPPTAPAPPVSPPVVADPAKGSAEVTVVARIVALPESMPPACGRGHFSILVEYEVVDIEDGEIAGTRFFAAHGCPDMLRARLKSLAVGDVHRIELSTNARHRGGMQMPRKPRPAFYWTKSVKKV